MAMIAGAYSITFNAVEVGVTETGFNCSLTPALVPVRTDEYGRSTIDFIFAGVESGFVRADVIFGSKTDFTFATLFPWLTVGTLNTTPGMLVEAGSLFKTLVLDGIIAARTNYSFAKAVCMNAQRNFSSTRLVTYTIEWQVCITPATGVLFTNP